MALLALPAELRLRVFCYLPDLLPHGNQNILPHTKLTPAICRVNSVLRRETLPIYATNSLFAFCIDDSPEIWKCRIDCWISALGPAISRIGSLQISRHWKILQPQRWQGHVGFYIRIDHISRISSFLDIVSTSSAGCAVESPVVESRGLRVTTGTYPMVRDPRNMRSESTELLARVFRDHLRLPLPADVDAVRYGLTGEDVRFLLQAIEVVASLKMPHTMDQGSHQQQRHDVLEDLEGKLRAIV